MGAPTRAHGRVESQRRDALGYLGALPCHPTSAATVGRAIVRALRALYCLRPQLSLSVGRRDLARTAADAVRSVSTFGEGWRRRTDVFWFFSFVLEPYSCRRKVPRALASRRTNTCPWGAAALALGRGDTRRRNALGYLGALPRRPTSAATVGRAFVRALRALYCLRPQLSLSVRRTRGHLVSDLAGDRCGLLRRHRR